MNNDSSPSSAANLPPASNSHQPSTDLAGDTVVSQERQENAQTPAQKRAQSQTKKKYEFVNNLMTNLDVLIYAELCILYYMDCSLFRLLIRALAQMMFLSPKPNFIPPMPQHRPYVPAIFVPNFMCILLHIFTARSEAGEAMRGYLHGGIIIDLIGQKGPTSKLHVVLLDLLVLALQCLMLAVHVERERLASALTAFLKPGTEAGLPRMGVVTSQNHDAEERGIMRNGITDNGDIEMQTMNSRIDGPSSRDNEAISEIDQERSRLLDEPPPQEQLEDDDHPLDLFWAGTGTVADFHILDTLRRQQDDYGNASASALQTVGFSAELANRRIAAAHQRFQRGVESLAI